MERFDQLIKDLVAQNGDYVTAAKARLAGAREALATGQREFARLLAPVQPVFEAARAKELRALAVGVSSQVLRRQLIEIFGDGGISSGLLASTAAMYPAAIHEIDHLSEETLKLYPHHEAHLNSAPVRLRDNHRAIEDLVVQVAFSVGELEDMLAARVGT